MTKKENRYTKIIETLFFKFYKEGTSGFLFNREEIETISKEQNIKLPKNIGDVIYSFRYRNALPESIVDKAPSGQEWIIMPAGKSLYKFMPVPKSSFSPSQGLLTIKIPDATPGIIDRYALNDEQSLLAKLRYNRLIDIFTGVTCYSLQNHLRTSVPDYGQIETDELYIGIDRYGIHYVIPIQAKGTTERIGIVQIYQDIAMCLSKFPNLLCKPIAAQFLEKKLIALFEFVDTSEGVKMVSEKHYCLVAPDELSDEELNRYYQIFSAKSN